MTRQQASERVRKLLTLAEGTSFPSERQTVAWTAATMCMKYQLTVAFHERLWNVLRCCVLESLATRMTMS